MNSLSYFFFLTLLFGKIIWSWGRMFFWLFLGITINLSPILAVGIWCLILAIFILGKTNVGTRRDAPDIKIEQQISFWEEQRTQQPTDRDVLINLARLYTAQGNPLKAEEYQQQAREIDPNF